MDSLYSTQVSLTLSMNYVFQYIACLRNTLVHLQLSCPMTEYILKSLIFCFIIIFCLNAKGIITRLQVIFIDKISNVKASISKIEMLEKKKISVAKHSFQHLKLALEDFLSER
jgi:hypothetical protein